MPPNEISIEVGGRQYSATYTVNDDYITLLYRDSFADCRVEGLDIHVAAGVLLRDLVSGRACSAS